MFSSNVLLTINFISGDAVYFPNKDLLAEYILNDSGCIFTGGYDQIAAKHWFYGQVNIFTVSNIVALSK